MTPINHSFTGPEIAKQVVGPMMGPMRSKTVSVKKCPTTCFVQIEAANSKWVITDSSSELKIFNALRGICSPAYISVDGVRYLGLSLIEQKFYLGEKPNVESLLSHQGSIRPSSPPTENTVAQVRNF